jgi:hypothetical protein
MPTFSGFRVTRLTEYMTSEEGRKEGGKEGLIVLTMYVLTLIDYLSINHPSLSLIWGNNSPMRYVTLILCTRLHESITERTSIREYKQIPDIRKNRQHEESSYFIV